LICSVRKPEKDDTMPDRKNFFPGIIIYRQFYLEGDIV